MFMLGFMHFSFLEHQQMLIWGLSVMRMQKDIYDNFPNILVNR